MPDEGENEEVEMTSLSYEKVTGTIDSSALPHQVTGETDYNLYIKTDSGVVSVIVPQDLYKRVETLLGSASTVTATGKYDDKQNLIAADFWISPGDHVDRQ